MSDNCIRLLKLGLLTSLFLSGSCYGQTLFVDQQFEFDLIPDVVYGQGLVNASHNPVMRDLKLDMYKPRDHASLPSVRPAILLAFGGSFHRGFKSDEVFYEDGAQDSSMAEYCRAFARRGYTCFSMEYRLTPEDPGLSRQPDSNRIMNSTDAVAPARTGRIDFARAQMGLPPLDNTTRVHFWNAILAATEDMQSALSFIVAQADAFNIDSARIAIGGFSAGAMTAINVAYGTDAPVQAVFALSGSSWGYDLQTMRPASEHQYPPLLMFAGQYDLPGIISGSAAVTKHLKASGVEVSTSWVPNFGHFYPRGAVSLSDDFSRDSVERRIRDFLLVHLIN